MCKFNEEKWFCFVPYGGRTLLKTWALPGGYSSEWEDQINRMLLGDPR
jgi:hypothetical protein